MTEHTNRPDRQLPEQSETVGSGPTGKAGERYTDTRRATGMGNPGTFGEGPAAGNGGAAGRVRSAAGGRLEDAARRVRELGDRAAERNALLARTRPLVYNAAENIDDAAQYVRTHELDEMRNDLETQVRRHPLASVAIAFLAGYTLRRIF